jgi:hypothetical protein
MHHLIQVYVAKEANLLRVDFTEEARSQGYALLSCAQPIVITAQPLHVQDRQAEIGPLAS